MDVLARIRAFTRRHDLIRQDTRVVAAVSGGSDSVALAFILAEMARRGELQVAGLVHVNHQLRTAAGADERFVRDVAARLGARLCAYAVDVRDRARRERRSLEDAARAARYEAFERARAELGADLVALGHTKDDQAETFLLRLLRGAGPRGLSSMHPRHGSIVRPLLDVRRDELRAWLRDRDLSFVDDETNADVSIPRNRVRAELLPLLASRFNPAIVDVLAGEAELARELSAWLDEEARAFGADLDVARLGRASPGLRRLVLWRAMTQAAEGRSISFAHVTAALRLVESNGGAVDVPGVRLQRIGDRIVLIHRRMGSEGSTGSQGSAGSMGSARSAGSPAASNPSNLPNLANLSNPPNPSNPSNPSNLSNLENLPNLANPANLFWYALSIPGEVVIAEAGCVVSAQAPDNAGRVDGVAAGDRRATVGNGSTALIRRDLVRGPWAVRNRRPGDRFHPVGLGGSKKLQDLFVDRKVARGERDAVPVVVDDRDRIVWVAGHGIDEAFRITDPSQAVLVLRLMRA